MTTFFVLLLIAAVVAFVLTKKSAQPIKLVGNLKKVETAVAKTLDVNGDGKVDIKDVKAATEVVKKVRKPRAKKITSKKKN
jgi:archaellum component FlaG (FlaF/FlaG flagellin family)